ncbi:MAG: hypothetical protein IJK07_09760 [Bacteroidales bacterium]|nr:hypothetical protein [Bacteroidales bacterium]
MYLKLKLTLSDDFYCAVMLDETEIALRVEAEEVWHKATLGNSTKLNTSSKKRHPPLKTSVFLPPVINIKHYSKLIISTLHNNRHTPSKCKYNNN